MSKRTVSAKGGATPAEGHRTRRAALGALASALAIPKIGAMAALPDPIFAAIERHSAAWAIVATMAPAVDEVAAMRKGREIAQVDWDAYERASALAEAALDSLLTMPPASFAGIRAAMEYLTGYDDGRLPDNIGQFLVTLLKSPLFVGDACR
jgi:hypothetical protein